MKKAREVKLDNLINLMLNEHAGQFYKAVHCKVTRQLKPEAQMGLKHRRFGTETEHVQINFGVV